MEALATIWGKRPDGSSSKKYTTPDRGGRRFRAREAIAFPPPCLLCPPIESHSLRAKIVRSSEFGVKLEVKIDIAAVNASIDTEKIDIATVRIDIASVKANITTVRVDIAVVRIDIASVKANIGAIAAEL